MKSAAGKMKPTVRDGVLVVEHAHDDYLQNAQPIEIVTDDIGEIIVRAKATKGSRTSRSAGARKRSPNCRGASASTSR